ncbi:MAG: PIG-L family deacetylase [Verrucomicrobiales bacterium]|nr:PIG-L family deacetylase [Verrucomicrobiales bacterium]
MAEPQVALAIAAHPDDIEFLMAGTLLLLRERGWSIHYFNLSTGNCGSATIPASKLRRMRRAEAREAARILGARWHPPIADDLEIFYEDGLLRRVAAVVRKVRPSVVLTHALVDYMEDHMNTARLAVTATFARGMPNYRTRPAVAPFAHDATVYHAVPHGLRDPLGGPVEVNTWVNTSRVQELKRNALAAHTSQRSWLDESQGMDSYVQTMEEFARELGRRSRRFTFAEAWSRHTHLGFCAESADPLRDALGADYLTRSRRSRPDPAG